MAVKPIPEGYRSITPYLVVQGASTLLDFLTHAFDAQILFPPLQQPDGTIMHAEVRVGDSIVMMGEAAGKCTPMPASLYLYVYDMDTMYQRALAAGATSLMEPADQFYGDRTARVQDPAGNQWCIATHKEDLSLEEIEQRTAASQQL
jgi:PhnB protein